VTTVGTGARTKGANGERELYKLLNAVLDEELGCHDNYLRRNSDQSRAGGYDLVGCPWLAIEVKRQEQLNINAWWQQTVRQAKPGQVPILLYRQNRKPWRAVMQAGLHVGGGSLIVARAEVSWEDFLVWFRTRARHEVG